jgi:type III secretory pathway component EscU
MLDKVKPYCRMTTSTKRLNIFNQMKGIKMQNFIIGFYGSIFTTVILAFILYWVIMFMREVYVTIKNTVAYCINMKDFFYVILSFIGSILLGIMIAWGF